MGKKGLIFWQLSQILKTNLYLFDKFNSGFSYAAQMKIDRLCLVAKIVYLQKNLNYLLFYGFLHACIKHFEHFFFVAPANHNSSHAMFEEQKSK